MRSTIFSMWGMTNSIRTFAQQSLSIRTGSPRVQAASQPLEGAQYMGRDPGLTPHARWRRMRLASVRRRGRLINDLGQNAPDQSRHTGDIPGGGSDACRGFGPYRSEYS